MMNIDDIQTGMVLDWQSETWPDKTSRWIVLEQLEDSAIEGRRFNLYCLQSDSERRGAVNTISSHLFRSDHIHKWTIHSQI